MNSKNRNIAKAKTGKAVRHLFAGLLLCMLFGDTSFVLSAVKPSLDLAGLIFRPDSDTIEGVQDLYRVQNEAMIEVCHFNLHHNRRQKLHSRQNFVWKVSGKATDSRAVRETLCQYAIACLPRPPNPLTGVAEPYLCRFYSAKSVSTGG